MKVVLIFASRSKVGATEVIVAGASAVTSRALEERGCTVKVATQVVTARMRLTLVEVVVDVHLLVLGVGRFIDGLDPDLLYFILIYFTCFGSCMVLFMNILR